MGLAPFFDKAALAAATVLQGFDRDAFALLLDTQVIEVAYDNRAASSQEGWVTLELVTNLLARLYPRMAFTALAGGTDTRQGQLKSLAQAINPNIEFTDAGVTVSVVVGATELEGHATPVIYAGSYGWIARLSTERSVGCGTSANPFGAAAAACFATANVFRVVFGPQLQASALDRSITMSVLDLDPTNDAPPNPKLGQVSLDEVQLVGAGAIGSSFIWTLARAGGISGTLDVIDGETLDATNPQRYVTALESDVEMPKTELAMREFAINGSALIVRPHPTSWARYMTSRSVGFQLRAVAVAVDSGRDRIAVQAALPREVFNAWTQAGDLGVSRHRFTEGACLACLYIPDHAAKNEDQLVADAIGLPDRVREVRELLHFGTPVGPEWISAIANAMQVDPTSLLPFADRPLRAFYSEALCGGLIMRLGGASGSGTDVPLAFQSALAGVLLAAAVVAGAAALPRPAGTKAVVNLLRPLGTHLTVPVAKHASGKCICQDPDYTEQYDLAHVRGDA